MPVGKGPRPSQGHSETPLALFLVIVAITLGSTMPAGAAQDERGVVLAEAELFAAAMDSENPEDWVKGLARLEFLLEHNAGTLSADLTSSIVAYLTARSDQSPQRTAKILESSLLARPDVGERVYLEVLRFPSAEQSAEGARRFLARLCRTPARHAALVTRLHDDTDETRFPRLFAVLLETDPASTTASIFRQLGGTVSGEWERLVLRALNKHFRVRLENRDQALAWWRQHDGVPVVEMLIGDPDHLAQRVWEDATDWLKQGPPLAYRDWLVGSLAREGRIRALAVERLQAFAHAATSGGQPIPQRRELLTPALAALLGLLGESTGLSLAERLQVMAALGEFSDFGSDPELVARLTVLVAPLPANEIGNPAPPLGVAAVKVAGRLAAPVGDPLDALLGRVVRSARVAGTEEVLWPEELDGLVTAILGSLRRIGPRSATIPLLRELLQHGAPALDQRPGSREFRLLAVQVLVNGAERLPAEDDRRAVFAVYTELLSARDLAGNVIKSAILGLGNLRYTEGIPELERMVNTWQAENGEIAQHAVRSIGTIGGAKAAQSLRRLKGQYHGVAEALSAVIQDTALKLVSEKERRYSLLRIYVARDDGGLEPWLRESIESPRIALLLDPREIPVDFPRDMPEEFLEWLRLHGDISGAELERCAEKSDLVTQSDAYRQVAQSSGQVLGFLRERELEAPRQEVEVLDRYALLGNERAAMLRALLDGDREQLCASLVRVLTSPLLGGSARLAEVHWLLSRVKSRERTPGELELVRRVRDLCQEHGVRPDDALAALLDELRQRNEPAADGAGPPTGATPPLNGPRRN